MQFTGKILENRKEVLSIGKDAKTHAGNWPNSIRIFSPTYIYQLITTLQTQFPFYTIDYPRGHYGGTITASRDHQRGT